MSMFRKQSQIKDEKEEKFGLTRMTKESIVKLCKKNQLYVTPHLNDVLYLHYQGYQQIESLEEYTGLKCLWLESNAISEISGLDGQSQLRCLFMHNNLLKKIENLSHCTRLDTVNFSNNFITTIENCGSNVLPELSTLNIAHNKIKSLCDFERLADCGNLSVLDLSHNRIDDVLIVGILGKMPELRVLMMMGNPVVSLIPMYRKTLINECSQLTYLDTRPVFDRDRACAVAWKRGGYEEERKEHSRWNRAERKKVRDGVNATLALRIQRSIERGEEPTVELLVSSSDDEDDDRAITDGSGDSKRVKRELRRERKFEEYRQAGDGVYSEIDDSDLAQQELYDEYCNQTEENLVMEYDEKYSKHFRNEEYNRSLDDLRKEKSNVLDCSDNSFKSSEVDSQSNQEVTAEGEYDESENKTFIDSSTTPKESNEEVAENNVEAYFENIPEAVQHTKPHIDEFISKELENITDPESIRIQTKRKMIIQQILQQPTVTSTSGDVHEVHFASDMITDITVPEPNASISSTNEDLPIECKDDGTKPDPEPIASVSPIKDGLPTYTVDNTSSTSRSEPFQEHVDKLVEINRNHCPALTDTESETDYQDYDDIDSFVADVSAKPTTTIRGFLQDYNEFVDNIQTKLDKTKTAISDLKTLNPEQYKVPDQVGDSKSAQEDAEIPDLDLLHKGLLDLVIEDHDSKQCSIERMLQCSDPIFDIPEDMLNNELDAIRDKAQTELDDLINRVYLKKELYKKQDTTVDTVESAEGGLSSVNREWIRNYYSEYYGQEERSGKTTSKPLEKLKTADDGSEKLSNVRFYCEDLTKIRAVENDGENGENMFDNIGEQLDSIEEFVSEEIYEDTKSGVFYQMQLGCEDDEVVESAEERRQETLPDTVQNKEIFEEIYKTQSSCSDDEVVQSVERLECEEENESQDQHPDTDQNKEISDEPNLQVSKEKIEERDENTKPIVFHQMQLGCADDVEIESAELPECGDENEFENALPDTNQNVELTDEPNMQLVEEVSELHYIQSLVYTAPKVSDIVMDEPYFEEGEFGLTADQAAQATIELRESPEFQKHINTLVNLDQQLDEKIQNFMLDASIEFGILNELEKSADPNDDEETDIVLRAEKYTSEFKERVNECKKSNNL